MKNPRCNTRSLLSALVLPLMMATTTSVQARDLTLFDSASSSTTEIQYHQQQRYYTRRLRSTAADSQTTTSAAAPGPKQEASAIVEGHANEQHRRLQAIKKVAPGIKKQVGGGAPPAVKKQGPGIGGPPLASKKQGPAGPAAIARPASAGDDAAPRMADEDRPGFDFIVGGFPKCGTTSLLKAFAAHEETAMAASEQCAIASPGQADAVVQRKLDDTLATLDPSPTIKRSFKCPTAMYNYKSIVRMEKHSPDAKFVVGVRHPVKMLQSFYNYRVTEIHERELDEPIPSIEEVLSAGEPWKGVSMESTKFELFLMQLGKTRVTPAEMNELVGQKYELAIKPTTFKVFLYNVDQLEDSNEERTGELRRVMQEFLGLTKPIQPFGHENKNHQVGDAGHKESINICDDRFIKVRAKLVEQGKQTAIWLRDHFINSPDVVIANRDHFIQTLELWGLDPCKPEITAKA